MDHRDSRTESASAHLIGLPEWESARRILLYKAYGSELSTDLLFQAAVDFGKEIFLPVTLDDHGSMTIGSYTPTLSAGRFGISEPSPLETIPEIDLIVVPGVAFDRTGNRLGQGKGYYDRFLAQQNALTVGFCFDCQITETVPTEPHDHPLDLIVTDKEVIRCGGC